MEEIATLRLFAQSVNRVGDFADDSFLIHFLLNKLLSESGQFSNPAL